MVFKSLAPWAGPTGSPAGETPEDSGGQVAVGDDGLVVSMLPDEGALTEEHSALSSALCVDEAKDTKGMIRSN
jgi:hypothetical protein